MKHLLFFISLFFYSYFAFTQITPSDIPGLKLWLSADSLIRHDAGNNVQFWLNRINTNDTVYQNNQNQKPLLVDSEPLINNMPCIRYDGTNDILFNINIHKIGSAFVVSRWNGSETVFPNYIGLFSTYIPPSGKPYIFLTDLNTSYLYPSGIPWDSIFVNNVPTLNYSPLDRYKIVFGRDPDPEVFTGFVVGGDLSNNTFWKGDIAEIIIYDTIISAYDKTNIEQYLHYKYAPPVNLGTDITANGFCDTTILANKSWYINYAWTKTGNIDTLSVDSVLTVSSSGNYSVTVTDIFGFTSTDSINVTFPDLAINDTIICFGDTAKHIISQSFINSFLWSNGNTTNIFKTDSAGQYTVQMTDNLGCTFNDTFNVFIDSLKNQINLGLDSISLCAGNNISLSYYPENPDSLTYLWSDNLTTDSIFTVYTSGLYSITVTNNRGCSGSDSTNVIVTGTAPIVNFSTDTVCLGNITTFSNNSSLVYDSLILDFGDGNDTNFFNTSHFYSLPGNYFVTLTMFYQGCSNVLSKTAVVKPKPQAAFSYSSSCAGFPVEFVNLSTPQGSGIILNYLWNFAGLQTSNFENPSYVFVNSGDYSVTLSIAADNGCLDSITKIVSTVDTATLPSVSLNQPYNNSIVSNNSINFSWNFSNSINFILELSLDNTFSSIYYADTTSVNQTLLSLLLSNNQIIFWRVRAFNYCYQDTLSDIFKFTFFNPSFVNSNILWCTGDSVDTINGKVNTLYDLSGNNNHANQANPSFQPYLMQIVTKLNNHSSVLFDSTFLTFSQVASNSYSFFTIINAGTEKQNVEGYIGTWSNTDLGNLNWSLGVGKGNYGNGTNAAGVGGDGNLSLGSTDYIDTNHYYILSTIKDTVQWKLYCNTNHIRDVLDDSAQTYPDTLKWAIGSSDNYYHGGTLSGEIAELIIYNKAISESERNSVEQYLRYKYAPPVYLGPDITANGFCDTTIHTGARFINYAWTKTGGIDTLSVDSTLTVSSSGNYSVTVTDIFGFTSTDSINVTFPNLAVSDSTICFGDTLKYTVNYGGTDSILWSNGDTGNFFQTSIGGQYSVIMKDFNGCTFNDTFYIFIDSLLLKLNLGNDTDLCYGNTISPISGTNLIETNWWEPSNDTTLYTTIIGSGNYIIHATSYNGCIASDTININMMGVAPNVGYSTSIVCEKNIAIFTDTSTTTTGDSLISWNWNIANFPTYTDSVISVTFGSAGTFPVLLTISSSNGCSNTLLSQIIVNPLPIPDFKVEGNCLGENSFFTNLTIVNGSYTSTWSFGDDSISNSLNPSHVFQSLGNYNVALTSTNSVGCTDSVKKSVEIKPAPSANFDFSPVCLGNSTYFFDLSEVLPIFPIQEWNWNFGDGNIALYQNPNHIYNSIGQFNVQLYIKSLNGCTDTITKTVTVSSPPIAGFIGDSACVGTPLNFIDTSYALLGTISKWNWNFGNGTNSTDSLPIVMYSNTGDYTVTLSVTSNVDCINSASKIVSVYSNPTADFTSSVNIGAPPLSVYFMNSSLGAMYYYWEFGDNGQSQLLNPTYIFADTGDYTVWLKVKSSHGCFDSTYKSVKIVPELYDLSLSSVETTINNGYLSAKVTLANQGTMPIINPQLVLNTNKNTPVLETYQGTIFSGDGNVVYSYVSQIPISENNMPAYVCVKGSLSDGKTEIDYTNNEVCKVLIQNQTLLSLYPNPTNNKLNINLNIKTSGNAKLEIIDKTGRIVYSNNVNMVVGFNHLEIDVSNYSKGKYTIHLTNADEEIKADFVKY